MCLLSHARSDIYRLVRYCRMNEYRVTEYSGRYRIVDLSSDNYPIGVSE